MSWLLDSPFVLFETPIWIQVVVAIPYWAVYFAIKGIIRWRKRRRSDAWLAYIYQHGSRRERDAAWHRLVGTFGPPLVYRKGTYVDPGA